MKHMVTLGSVWIGLLAGLTAASTAGAQDAPQRKQRQQQRERVQPAPPAACDTAQTRHAVNASDLSAARPFTRPFTAGDSAAGAATDASRGVVARRGAGRTRTRVRKDGTIVVVKDGRQGGLAVRKDQRVFCPQVNLASGEVESPIAPQPAFVPPELNAATGEVVPVPSVRPGFGPRGFFVPPIIGGIILGGGAIAITNRPHGASVDSMVAVVPVDSAPVKPTPTDSTPTKPTPTDSTPTKPTPTDSTPTIQPPPIQPPPPGPPATVPEPATVALVAGGVAVLGASTRRRRR